MGFKNPRPERLREVVVDVPGGDDEQPRAHKGVELDDVLRQILWDMADREGWSGNETARRVGIKQPTLQDFMDEEMDRGFTLASLSRICAALKVGPDKLFRMHGRYHPESRDDTTFVEDLVFDRFRALLAPSDAKRLVRLIEVWNDRGSLSSQLDGWERAAGVSAAVVAPKKRKGLKHKAL